MVGLANVSSHTFGLRVLVDDIDAVDLYVEDLFNSLFDLDLVGTLFDLEDDGIFVFLRSDRFFCDKRTDNNVSSVTHYLIPPLFWLLPPW